LRYRPEIDGLRSLAVVPVVLFHARVPGFSGGYAGVDVFFVISGYLITGILLANEARGLAGLASFYERRARRILPALLLVLAAAWAGAWALYIPEDFRRFSQAIAATALFASNLLFAIRNDYFGGEEGFAPLVHTWSLAVEEQFYLLYPIALLAIRRWRPALVAPAIAAVLAASFVGSLAIAPRWPELAFNLLPTRAWELMAGALCAVLPPPAKKSAALGEAGLGLIAAGYALITPETPPAGAWFLLPVIGSAMVLRHAAATNAAGRLLSVGPLVGLGLISYGFYLWHQVLLAFADYTRFPTAGGWLRASAVGAALVMAFASWRYVERPIRERRMIGDGRSLAAVCIAGLALAAVAGLAGHLRWLGPRSASEAEALDLSIAVPGFELAVPPGTRALPFLLYGDSHAQQYYPALRARFGEGAMIARSGCMSLPAVSNQSAAGALADACRGQFAEAMAVLRSRRVQRVIWVQRWERALYRNGDGAALGETSARGPELLNGQLDTARAAMPAGTALVLVGNEPTAWAAGDQMIGGWLRCRAYEQISCPTQYPANEAEGRAANAVLRAYAASHAGVSYVDAAGALCHDGICPIIEDGKLFYADGSHLTRRAAARVVAGIPPD
jgi:peptidoglycan/LPS O-acetylase OafA/YrhL